MTFPALDEALVKWIGKCERWKLPIVTDGTIREKAAKIRDELIAATSPAAAGAMKTMAFSNGWLGKFMNGHHLTSRHVQGEAASVDLSAVEKGRAALQQITQAYARRDVFNMDETAYFYCTPPNRTISSHQVSGRKNPKKRLTVAVACNPDGSTKLRLLFIGSSRQPRCFHGKSCVELGVDYTSTAKAWMNTQLFNCWVARFNDAMRAEGRHVLLLLDNVSSHRVDEPLSNVSVQMLPPNTTPFLQPQDAGIIRQFKAQILKRQNRHALDWLDNILERAAEIGEENIGQEIGKYCNVDVLVAMRWAQEAWEMVTTTTISNCWRHTNILDENMYSLIDCIEWLR